MARRPPLPRDLIVPDDIDFVLPSQWPRSASLPSQMGIARLGAAVLREAFECLRCPPSSSVYQDAVRFFLGAPDPCAPVTLDLACQLAGKHPRAIRQAVERHVARREAAA